MIKNWKFKRVDKWRDLWTKGKFVNGKGYPDWINVDKTTGAVSKYTKDRYMVAARRKINKQTTNGHHRFYTTKAAAKRFVMSYIKKH